MGTTKAKCVVCEMALTTTDFGCARCHTPYHLDCFSSIRQCATAGCTSQQSGLLRGAARDRGPAVVLLRRSATRRVWDALHCLLLHPEVVLLALGLQVLASGIPFIINSCAQAGLLAPARAGGIGVIAQWVAWPVSLGLTIAVVVWRLAGREVARKGRGRLVSVLSAGIRISQTIGGLGMRCLAVPFSACGLLLLSYWLFDFLERPYWLGVLIGALRLPGLIVTIVGTLGVCVTYMLALPIAVADDDTAQADPLGEGRRLFQQTRGQMLRGYALIVFLGGYMLAIPSVLVAQLILSAGEFACANQMLVFALFAASFNGLLLLWLLTYTTLVYFESRRSTDHRFMPNAPQVLVGATTPMLVSDP